MKVGRNIYISLSVSLAAAGWLMTPLTVSAEDAPLSYKAAPEVYKLLAENDQFRVILQSLKPGQRDAWHSHSALAAYRLTDCTSRLHYPDGKSTAPALRKAGEVTFRPAEPSHSLENTGKTDCDGLIVERK